jgi:hypothetical protein
LAAARSKYLTVAFEKGLRKVAIPLVALDCGRS